MLSKNILLFLFFITNITFVISQLPILHTLDKSGNYIQILNKHNGLTQHYKGGIYLAKQDENGVYMENVHKLPDQTYFTPRANHNPQLRGIVLDNLYTRKKDGKYIEILNKDGTQTKKYNGGIFLLYQDGTIKNVHKQPNQNFIQQNQIIQQNFIQQPQIIQPIQNYAAPLQPGPSAHFINYPTELHIPNNYIPPRSIQNRRINRNQYRRNPY
jgi:hypothetical protein